MNDAIGVGSGGMIQIGSGTDKVMRGGGGNPQRQTAIPSSQTDRSWYIRSFTSYPVILMAHH
jgi:hypothetical protein